MIITLTRTGGFTGIPVKKTIDTTKLPADQAKEIVSEIEALQRGGATGDPARAPTGSETTEAVGVGRGATGPRQPIDRFIYTLSFQNEEISQEITIPEEKLKETTGTLKSLVDLIEKT